MTATVNIQDGVALIQLDDGKANAFSHDMIASLNTCMDEAEASAKAVVFAGREGRFSAGFDLRVMQGATPEEVQDLVRSGGEFALRVFDSPLPTVAACTGHALAMGAIFLLACDSRIGADGAFKIGLNETAIGMVLPRFGIELPRHRLRPDFHTQSMVQARIFDPKTAAEAGFLDIVVAPDKVMETAMGAAAMLAQLPGKAYAGNKKLVRSDVSAILKDSLQQKAVISV